MRGYFNRPSRTPITDGLIPSDKSLGYCQTSLRDEELRHTFNCTPLHVYLWLGTVPASTV